jgi:hypothetical protein
MTARPKGIIMPKTQCERAEAFRALHARILADLADLTQGFESPLQPECVGEIKGYVP